MKLWPKLSRATLPDLFNWCQRVELLRAEDVQEVARLNQLAAPTALLHAQYTDVGNVGTGEDNLMGYTVPGGVLSQDGFYLDVLSVFAAANNANVKAARLRLGGTQVAIAGPSASLSNFAFSIRTKIIRTGASTQRVVNEIKTPVSSGVNVADVAVSGSPLVLRATGEAVADNDIVQKLLLVRWLPATQTGGV